MSEDGLRLAHRWECIADDLLRRTEKFPKVARYSLASRIDNLAIDILEGLVEARYSKGQRRREVLARLNLRLTRLRVLLRLSHRRGYLAKRAYEVVSGQLDEAGRMLGGWLRTVDVTAEGIE